MAPPRKGKGSAKGSKQASKQASAAASGTATPVPKIVTPVEVVPTTVGINFGQSYSSVAVINKEGEAECIANDDGERQIPTVIAFGTDGETYYGSPARYQLIRNPTNTIVGFRNMIGKPFAECAQAKGSAPVVDVAGQAGYKITAGETEKTVTAAECVSDFIRLLVSYATDFLGRPVTDVVIASNFTGAQKDALVAAARAAGAFDTVTIVADEAAALLPLMPTLASANVLVVDVGASTTQLDAVVTRAGLIRTKGNASVHAGGDDIDDVLAEWFAKEFTKKTSIVPANDRSRTKLRLAVEGTKKVLAVSSSAACSIDSLADGADLHSTVNRTRLNLLARPIYNKIVAAAEQTVAEAGWDVLDVEAVVFVGGSDVAGLADAVLGLFPNATAYAKDQGTTIARGLAMYGQFRLLMLAESRVELDSLANDQNAIVPTANTQMLGLAAGEDVFPLLLPETPLPAQVSASIPATGRIVINLVEASREIKTEVIKAEDEDDEDEEVRSVAVKVGKSLARFSVVADGTAEVTLLVKVDGSGTITVNGQDVHF